MAGVRDKVCACCGLSLSPKKFGKHPGGTRKDTCLDCEDIQSMGIKTITSVNDRLSQKYLIKKW